MSKHTRKHAIENAKEEVQPYLVDDGLNDSKSITINIQPQETQETPENVQPTVQQVNKAVSEAGGVEELTEKQRKKQEAKAKQYWNTTITRKEAMEMVQDVTGELNQRLQLLMIQNRTLLEILGVKGVATEEEINEHSKQVIESIFGAPTEAELEEQGE